MNVLILTPDAVGSTFLQRLITIYMQFYDFDRPVINLHELTNGLEKYYSPEFNREIVSKRKVKSWGYYQSLEQIVELLSSVDHYKTSRLAQYHIRGRQDPIEQQIPFYRYLDENFFIIACRRKNVFEHAVSMSINTITKRLNVYDPGEKISAFLQMYADPVDLDQEVMIQRLESYRQYLSWAEDFFNIGSYFYYDTCMHDIESYISDLPMFKNRGPRITWEEKFGVSLNDWNRCRWVSSDLGSLPMDSIVRLLDSSHTISDDVVEHYQQLAPSDWPSVHNRRDIDDLPDTFKERFQVMLQEKNMFEQILRDQPERSAIEFVKKHQLACSSVQQALERMRELDIIVSEPPIKKQTLGDKKRTIKNWDQCVDTYNAWAAQHSDIASGITADQIDLQIQQENDFWRRYDHESFLTHDLPPIQKLECQNDDNP